MLFESGIWPSNRIASFAAKLLHVAVEKMLNMDLSYEKSLILMKNRDLKKNLNLIKKKNEIRIRDRYGPLKKEFKTEIIFRELAQPEIPVKEIRSDIIEASNKEKEYAFEINKREFGIYKAYASLEKQYIEFNKHFDQICRLYRSRINELHHHNINIGLIDSAEIELTELFCESISIAINKCRCQLI